MPFNQRFRAGELEPSARSWASAAAGDRRAYFEEAGRRILREKRAELARAIGSNGRRMRPRKHPRPDGANGPVLTPHRDESRTMRLMDFHADSNGVTLFWHGGISKTQRLPWGTILGFHAAGQVRGAPRRDVRLSAKGLARVRRELAAWWTDRMRSKARDEAEELDRLAPRKGKRSWISDYLRPKGRKGF